MLHNFWRKNPAFMLGLFLLLGIAFSFHAHWIYLLTGLILTLAFGIKSRYALMALLSFLIGWMFCNYQTPTLTLGQEKLLGEAHFSISSLSTHQSPFQRSLVYRGVLKEFKEDEATLIKNLPCQIFLPLKTDRPLANCDYLIKGTLSQKAEKHFIFKPFKDTQWKPLSSSFSFAEWRYQNKLSVNSYLKKHFSDERTRSFLNALATGDLDDRTLKLEFGQIGLQHILAISGFHFALIALFLNVILRLFFPHRVCTFTLLILLSAYAFFLGSSPSIQRAWIAIFVFLLGNLFNLRTTALNALGIGLIIELLIDPSVIGHIGFQLSFLCTLSILILYPATSELCEKLLPKRSFEEIKALTPLNQYGYLLSSLIRPSIALTLAIQCVSLPVVLFLFHRFPLLSILYNFFFPFWVSLSLLLLCCGILLSLLVPPLGEWTHSLNSWWTHYALSISANPPIKFDFVLRTKIIPYPVLILFLTITFLAAIYWSEKKTFPTFSLFRRPVLKVTD